MENVIENQSQQPVNSQVALPNSTGVLVMGIISIATCWCYGVPGIVLGIISLSLGGKAKKLYEANSSLYTLSSFKNLKAGRTCAIIGLSLSALYLLFLIIYIIFLIAMGAAVSTAFGTMPWDSYSY